MIVMKKLLMPLMLALILTALPLQVSFGFEATSAMSFGLMSQSGQPAEFAYDFGVNIQVVDAGNGWTIKNATSALYSDRAAGEMQVFRNMTVTEKALFYGEEADGTMRWDFHLALGSGLWRFMNTEGEDKTSPAYHLGAGFSYKGVALEAGVDAVQMEGPDLYYPNMGLSFSF